jgi:ABC-type sugar transport system substrate-binding protein
MRTNFGRRAAVALVAVLTVGIGVMTSAVAGASAKSKPSIIWLEQGSGNAYWTAQHAAAAVAGNQLGFAFKAVSGNSNPQDQASIMMQLVNQHPTVIMLNAISPPAMANAIKYAKKKGVKVLNLYGVDPLATASIEFNEQRTGRLAAELVAKLLKQRYGSVKGQVAVLSGVPGQPASDDRGDGFTNYMKTQHGVQVVAVQPTQWLPANASSATQDLLTKYPNLAFIYTESDTLGLPAANIAARQNRLCTQQSNWKKNPSCVGIVSADGIYANQVVTGKFFATELYSPQWTGYQYAKLAYDMALGKQVPSNTVLKSMVIDPQNASCVVKMANKMVTQIKTFPFAASLQQIATKKFGCKVVDNTL